MRYFRSIALWFVASGALLIPCYGLQTVSAGYAQQLHAGTVEIALGHISAAEADIQAAIALDPNEASGWYELGSLFGQVGDFKNAEVALRRAVQLEPDLAKAHFSLALTLIGKPQDKLDWQGAIAECREALKYEPAYPEALSLLGMGLANTGETEQAVQALTQAIQLSPKLPEAHFNLAVVLESENKWKEAAEEYQAAISARPNYPLALAGLGKLLIHEGQTTQAEGVLESAVRLNPDLVDAHYALAQVLRSLHRSQDAAMEFAEATDLLNRQPKEIQAAELSNQGLELAAKGDLAGAIVKLREAVTLKPDYGVPHYNLGLVLADSGDLTDALRELTKAISLLPGESRTWLNLGRVLQRSGDRRGAIEAVTWAAYIAPSDKRIADELASLRAGQTLAPDDLPQTTERPKIGAVAETAPAHLAFAIKLKADGDSQGAIGEFLRTLAIDPTMISARKNLAETYLLLGDKDRALLEYRKLVVAAPTDHEALLAYNKLLQEKKSLPAVQ